MKWGEFLDKVGNAFGWVKNPKETEVIISVDGNIYKVSKIEARGDLVIVEAKKTIFKIEEAE